MELSKSAYCRGIQCHKIVWMDNNKPEEAVTDSNEAVLMTGSKVGALAREYFGECSLVEYNPDKQVMVEATKSLMNFGEEVIAEASFYTDGLFCAVDILKKNDDGWDIIEVKSSTGVGDIYIEDVAFQNYVLTKCGVKVNGIFIMHIDNTYVFHEKLNLKGLFALEDYTDVCTGKYGDVEKNVAYIRQYAGTDKEPEKEIDMCCDDPYECSYKPYCWKNVPKQSVFDIRRLNTSKKYKLFHDGIVTFEDIVKNRPSISATQMRQAETGYYHSPDHIDKEAIRSFLDTLYYPVYHLDFETFQLAIPEWEGCRPYEQIPFQYSLHIEHEDGTLEHREFLAKEGTDPRRMLAETLCSDIPMDVCGLAYNMSFERRVLAGLADIFPDLCDHLMNIRENMHDLMIPFQKQHYYTEAMQGSYSIKYVLPALFPNEPELDYQNLDMVHNGSEASAAFMTMTEHSPEEIATLRDNLLKYCGLDTYAMVKVLGRLKEL